VRAEGVRGRRQVLIIIATERRRVGRLAGIRQGVTELKVWGKRVRDMA